MNEQRLASDREDLARRVADFRKTQATFQRAREEYYEATIRKVRALDRNDRASPSS
jgi:hypothetical protein